VGQIFLETLISKITKAGKMGPVETILGMKGGAEFKYDI
jgi:hypothetical protein